MTAIPEAIMDEARRLIAKIEGCTCMDCEDAVAESLLAAEQRGAERAAQVAERDVDWSRFGKGEIHEAWEGGPDAARDYRIGIVAGRAIAAAIRNTKD
jgi:hypothetical protein